MRHNIFAFGIEVPHKTVNLHGAEIIQLWQVIHVVAGAKAVDFERHQRVIVKTLIPDGRHTLPHTQVQYLIVLWQLDSLLILNLQRLLKYRSHNQYLIAITSFFVFVDIADIAPSYNVAIHAQWQVELQRTNVYLADALETLAIVLP